MSQVSTFSRQGRYLRPPIFLLSRGSLLSLSLFLLTLLDQGGTITYRERERQRQERYEEEMRSLCTDGEVMKICVPEDYMKFELPVEGESTFVSIGVDIKDIPKVRIKFSF